MPRKDFEVEILGIRFKHYTSEVQRCIRRIITKHKCDDTSNIVIDELWRTCNNDMKCIIRDRNKEDEENEEHERLELSDIDRDIIRSYIDQARDYEAELDDLDDDKFESHFRSVIEPIAKEERDRRGRIAKDNDRWAFFNKPDAEADFERWRNRLLQPAQAVALSLGKDPNCVKPESLEPYRRPIPSRSPFRETFKDRLDLVEAAVAAGMLSAPVSIVAFVDWAEAHCMELPPELTGKPNKNLAEDVNYWKNKYESAQEKLDKLLRDPAELPYKSMVSVYRLLVGMAVARFEYRTDQRTTATAIIRTELKELKLPLSDEAILDHLRTAASVLGYIRTTPIRWTGVKRPTK